MTFDHGIWLLTTWTYESSHIFINKPSLVQIGLQLFKWGHFHISILSYNLTSDDLWPWYMTFDHMNIWQFPYYTNQVWFKSDFNFSTEAIFTFSAFHTTWPQMTFDLGTWPLTAWTYYGSHIITINQVWFQSNFIFSNEVTFIFSAYLITWPQMTFDLDMQPLTSTNEGSHVASMTQLWLKSMRACGS